MSETTIWRGAQLSDRRLRIAAATVLFAGVSVATLLVAYPKMFSGFAPYDDEGYLLISLKTFLSHGSLYDEVFSQYGPFYYESWGGLFSLFGIQVTHDAGRMATLFAWVFASLALGVSTYRITRSALLGIVVQMAVFAGLGVMTQEPMHPGGLVAVLLAFIVLVSTAARSRYAPAAMAVLGAAVAALILVKVNVGAFAFAALLLALAALYPALASRRWLRLAIEAGFVFLPVVLMWGRLDQAWVRHYALHVTVAALALVLVLRSRSMTAWRPGAELRWLSGGLLGAGLLISLMALATGTSLGGLYDGVIGQPLRQPNAFFIPLQLPDGLFGFDLFAGVIAGAYLYVVRFRPSATESPWWVTVVALGSLLVGLELILATIGWALPFNETASRFGGYPLSMLGFAWVALIGVSGEDADRRTEFAGLLLPALAVLQALHAYPVAGSQVGWSSFLLIPVGAICISNGARGLLKVSGTRRWGLLTVGTLGAIALLLFLGNKTLRDPYHEGRAALDGRVAPLALNGAGRMRLLPEEGALYGSITSALNENCGAFVMLPGMNSFYLWSGQEPPTGFNATGWMTLFSDDLQQRVVAQLKPVKGLCLLRNSSIEGQWTGGDLNLDGPLLRFMGHGFKPVAAFGPYELLKRSAGTGGAS